jgi:MFS family permease
VTVGAVSAALLLLAALSFAAFVSSRPGHKKRTLLAGLGLIIVFSALSGASGSFRQPR